MDPILSSDGILEPPRGYMKRMVGECRKRGILVIIDESQRGVGRTGDFFTLASVSTTAEIERGCSKATFLWLTTHLNDRLIAAVIYEVLEISREDQSAKTSADDYRHGGGIGWKNTSSSSIYWSQLNDAR